MKKLLLLTITICSIGQGFTQKRKFGKITKEELKEKVCNIDSTAAAAYLYKTKDVTFEYDDEMGFRKNVKVHEIIKIYDDKAFTYGDQIIKYYNESDYNKDRFYKIKATTYNLVNNKIEETDVDRKEIFDEEYNEYYGLKKIAFPNLKKGSIIELFYEVVSVYLDIDDFKIQEEIPIKFIYHRTIIPEYFKFNKSSKGYMSLAPEVTNKYGKVFVGKGTDRVSIDFTEEHTVF